MVRWIAMITDGLVAFFKMAAMSSLATWPPAARQSGRRRSGLCRPNGVVGTEQAPIAPITWAS
jgi:hypothetical protein